MGWIISLFLLYGYFINTQRTEVLIASGLFAIAGAIGCMNINIEVGKGKSND